MLKCYFSLRTYLTGLLNRDDRGVTSVEYGLLVAFIALIMAVGATVFGNDLSKLFSDTGASL